MPKFFVKNEQIKDNEITILGEDVKSYSKCIKIKKRGRNTNMQFGH